MKVTVESLSTVERKLNISVPSTIVDEERKKSIEDFRRHANIKGFRKGKIPKDLVLNMFKSDIQKVVQDNLIKAYLPKAFEEQKLQPVSMPAIQDQKFDAEAFSFCATFEVTPTLDISNYQALNLPRETVAVEDAELDEELNRLRDMRAVLKAVEGDRPAAQGDFAQLDLAATLNGVELKRYTSTGFLIEIGKDDFLKGFDQKLAGRKIAETFTCEHELPADYHEEDIAGKTLSLTCTMTALKVKETPALDDEFAKSLGEFENLEELRAQVKTSLKRRKELAIDKKLSQQIVDELINLHKFDVPKSLIKHQLRDMIRDTFTRYQLSGLHVEPNEEEVKVLEGEYREEAEKSVKAMLILNAIAEKEKIEVADAEIEERVKIYADESPNRRKELQAYYRKDENREGLRYNIKIDKTLQFLLDKNTAAA